ncbi:hypothetical protein CDAR_18201 [Caerostris darwini]|uniref:Uncharacterized protein n=1 Tax=Caerostris darwini TaxID=1538125 RepID=A0AAV4V516_9ARAC|nr:hypothetical protein CDAR_18201 [Caerostris darwini]
MSDHKQFILLLVHWMSLSPPFELLTSMADRGMVCYHKQLVEDDRVTRSPTKDVEKKNYTTSEESLNISGEEKQKVNNPFWQEKLGNILGVRVVHQPLLGTLPRLYRHGQGR